MADDITPSAGSTGTVSSTISGTVSAHEALAQADSSPAVETPSAPPADQPVAATSQPAESPVPVVSDTTPEKPAPGPVPYDRFADVNRQRKELSERMKRFESLSHLNDQELSALTTWGRQLQDNPVEAYRMLQQAIAADPALAAAVAPPPTAVPQPDARATDPMPEADLRAEDGTLVYSATQMRAMQDWTARQLRQQMAEEFQQRLQPLEQVAQSVQQERAQAQAWSEVSSLLTEFRADPLFAQHEPDIRAMLMEDQRLASLADENPRLAVELAYGRLYREKIAPVQMAQTQQQVVENLRQRAVSGTANPAQPRSITPSRTIGDARAALASVFAD